MDRRTFIKGMGLALIAPKIIVEALTKENNRLDYLTYYDLGAPIDQYDFAEFVSAQLRAIADGIGVPYEILSKDMSKIKFSAARTALEIERAG